MPQFYTLPGQNGGYWPQVKSFSDRGGFFTGLNPNLVNRMWYVNGNQVTDQADKKGPVGADGNNGQSPFTPFQTMERAFEFVEAYDVIVVSGVIREQLVAPPVYNVTVIGSQMTPRQATEGGLPTGGGASWLPPATGAASLTPLLEIVRQGWTIKNMEFNPHTSSAAIRLTTGADPAAAGQFSFLDSLVLGGGTGQIGIEDNGGSGFVVINGCAFQLLTGTALLSLNTAIAIPLRWEINNNVFNQNTNDIKMSLSRARIQWNNFMTAGSGSTNKVVSTTFIAAQGNNNHVCHNVFTNTAAQVANASGFNAGAQDIWADNYCSDAVKYGIPS